MVTVQGGNERMQISGDFVTLFGTNYSFFPPPEASNPLTLYTLNSYVVAFSPKILALWDSIGT